jgi:hypothetical protein
VSEQNAPKLPDFSSETTIGDLVPEGYTAIDFTIQIKALDPSGQLVAMNAITPNLSTWEALGMLTAHANDVGDRMRRVFQDE